VAGSLSGMAESGRAAGVQAGKAGVLEEEWVVKAGVPARGGEGRGPSGAAGSARYSHDDSL
jgi:hypothetical protein